MQISYLLVSDFSFHESEFTDHQLKNQIWKKTSLIAISNQASNQF